MDAPAIIGKSDDEVGRHSLLNFEPKKEKLFCKNKDRLYVKRYAPRIKILFQIGLSSKLEMKAVRLSKKILSKAGFCSNLMVKAV